MTAVIVDVIEVHCQLVLLFVILCCPSRADKIFPFSLPKYVSLNKRSSADRRLEKRKIGVNDLGVNDLTLISSNLEDFLKSMSVAFSQISEYPHKGYIII